MAQHDNITQRRNNSSSSANTVHSGASLPIDSAVRDAIAAADSFLNSEEAKTNPLSTLIASLTKLLGTFVGAEHKQISAEQLERERSAVIIGIPESTDAKPSKRRAADRAAIEEILDAIDSEADPVTLYRMGVPDPERPRLLKVVFSTRHHQRQVISRFTELAREQKASFQFRDVFMRKSLTAEERETDRRLRDELKKRKDSGEKCWIYGGRIVTSRQPTRMQAADNVTSRRPNVTSRRPAQQAQMADTAPGNQA